MATGNIGARFRQVREDAGETQESLAERTKIRRPTIQKIEAGGNTTISTLSTLLTGCNSGLSKFFSAHIPDDYPNAKHAEIHEKLQIYLEKASNKDVDSVETVIDALYRMVEGGRRP